jgi:hypothetical protein
MMIEKVRFEKARIARAAMLPPTRNDQAQIRPSLDTPDIFVH